MRPTGVRKCTEAVLRAAAGIAAGVVAATSVLAQDAPRPGAQRILLPLDVNERVFEAADDIPPQLREALRGCNYESWVRELPVKLVRPGPGSRLIAFATCGSISAVGRAVIIERGAELSPIAFVVNANGEGFTTSFEPGWLDWQPATQTLFATKTTDLCDDRQIRYTYRYHYDGEGPFTLLRIEHRPQTCDRYYADWRVVWEAAPWEAAVRR